MAKKDERSETEIQLQAANHRISMMKVRISQLEEQYKGKEAHLQAEITRLLHIEESARRLCTLILSKDRGEMRLGEDYTWNSVNSEDLIRRTAESYTAYCKKRVASLQTIKDFAMEKSDCLDKAEETISRLRADLEQLSSRSASPQTEKIIRSMIQEDDLALKEAYSRGRLIIEDCGDRQKALTEQAVTMRSESMAREEADAGYKKQMKSARKKSDELSASEKTAIDGILNETRILANMLSPNESGIIRMLGGGMSVGAEIRKAMEISGKPFSEAHRNLAQKSLVATEANIKFPGTTTPNVLWLTLTGKQVYKLLTGEFPQIPECEKLKRYHATLEHGYGIRACFRLIRESKRYERINMFAEPINLYNGSKYQPDIVGSVKKDDGSYDVEYYEYERVRQTPEEYYAKFNKMALIMDEINVIVPNATEHGKMQEYMYTWAQHHKDDPEYANKVLRLTSYTTLEARIHGNMPFDKWWHVSEHLDSFPSARDA